MSDNRSMWGGLLGNRRPSNMRHTSPHKKYGYTYYKRSTPPLILDGKRKRVIKGILDSLGKK